MIGWACRMIGEVDLRRVRGPACVANRLLRHNLVSNLIQVNAVRNTVGEQDPLVVLQLPCKHDVACPVLSFVFVVPQLDDWRQLGH